ncbi:unnamed protein product [Bursaphelenchus okinawaensis]|uniref:Major facilitator superfamily (MFS) profile domain-containing protein n=1 Tax=Bursaphelenchus okinawaensis TaxID=465554 RepID=A0A811JSH6_9BILA|nr:unnamed protein product [Bursaphelenchus okinawaensis]CAG9080986.1 unnamed protein product [Bursaphelenchus okinawaensis]
MAAALWQWSSVRMCMVLMLAVGMAIHALLRGVFGMALVCIVPTLNSTAVLRNEFQVDWQLREISSMHMFFYAGTFLSVFAAHYFTLKFGAKHLISIGIVVGCVATALIPLTVYITKDYIFTSLLRLTTGIAQGFFIPCSSLLISKWFGPAERSTAMAVFTTGNQIGLAISMFATAELCRLNFFHGWPMAFLLYGSSGFVFLFFWVKYGADHPRQSTRITAVELAHIRDTTTPMVNPSSTPFKKLLFSPVVLAICLSSFCQSFVMVAMTSYLPEFHRSALHLNLSQNALWSASPFFVQTFSKVLFGVVADLAKTKLSPTFVAKTGNSIASFGCAACLLAVGYVEDATTMLILLSLGMALTSGYVPGYFTSIVSIAPNYTAAISAYAQGFAQVASILSPIVVGFMTKNSTLDEWTEVFQMLAGILILTGIVFAIFGSASAQKWAYYERKETAQGDSRGKQSLSLIKEDI